MKSFILLTSLFLLSLQTFAGTNKACVRTAKQDFKSCSKKLLPWKVTNYLGKITFCNQNYETKITSCSNTGGGNSGGETVAQCLDACQQDNLQLIADCVGSRSTFNLSYSIELPLLQGLTYTVNGVCDPSSSVYGQYLSPEKCDAAFYNSYGSPICSEIGIFETKNQCDLACNQT